MTPNVLKPICLQTRCFYKVHLADTFTKTGHYRNKRSASLMLKGKKYCLLDLNQPVMLKNEKQHSHKILTCFHKMFFVSLHWQILCFFFNIFTWINQENSHYKKYYKIGSVWEHRFCHGIKKKEEIVTLYDFIFLIFFLRIEKINSTILRKKTQIVRLNFFFYKITISFIFLHFITRKSNFITRKSDFITRNSEFITRKSDFNSQFRVYNL